MQEKLKHSSYLSNTDCSVEIPGVSGQIKVNTLLSDYVYARLYGTRRGSYNLAVCFMTHCLESLWKLKGVLLKFPTPNDPGYSVYKQLLDDVNKELKLENGNIETLQQVRDRRKARERADKEARQQKDIATLEGLQKCFTTGSAVWQRYADCITVIKQDKNPASEIHNLTDGMSRDLSVLNAIRTLKAGFSEPKTIFEQYLFDMSNYYEGWLNSGTSLASLDDYDFSLFVFALEHLGTLATSSKYAESPLDAKRPLLTDLTVCLSSLCTPLHSHDKLCCARDGYDPEDFLEKSLVFRNILANIKASCFSDKYKTPTTDRELLQIIFNDKRTKRELERFTERASLQTRPENAAITATEKAAALNYKSNCCTSLNAFLRVSATETPGSGNIKYPLARINNFHSVVTNLINLIRRTPTEREITVYRGVDVSRDYVRAYLTNMAGRLILAERRQYSPVDMSLDLAGITKQLKDDHVEMIYKDLSFMSTSVSKDVAIRFSGISGQTRILQKITVPKGTPCYAYPNETYRSEEEELLFLPGTKLKLKEINMIGGTPSTKHSNYTRNPELVTLCFDMIPPTEDELAEAARQRNAWVSQCPAMSANQANIENPNE